MVPFMALLTQSIRKKPSDIVNLVSRGNRKPRRNNKSMGDTKGEINLRGFIFNFVTQRTDKIYPMTLHFRAVSLAFPFH